MLVQSQSLRGPEWLCPGNTDHGGQRVRAVISLCQTWMYLLLLLRFISPKSNDGNIIMGNKMMTREKIDNFYSKLCGNKLNNNAID